MPKTGYKSITVSEDTYDKLEKIASKDHRSISNFLDVVSEMKW